jgi:acetyl esterase
VPAPVDPQVEPILAADRGLPVAQGPVAAREQYDRTALRFAGEPEPVATVRDEVVAGVPVRTYAPDAARGAVVFLHGGGWMVGTLDAYDPLCRALANRAGATVVSVDYRLAPEHPFPAALDDADAVLRDVLERFDAVAVAGDSAGGNLAAVLARRARGRVRFQLLVYPVTDAAMATASYAEYGSDDAYGLPKAWMALCWSVYAPHPAGRSPDASPIRAADLSGLPPAHLVLAECDPLTDEGLDYAERLRAAGVPVTERTYPGMVHGFFRYRAGVDAAHAALDEAAAAVRAALAG